jgi:hypothetical protein
MRIFPAFFVAVLLSLWIITASQRDDATRSVELGRPDSSALQAQLAERWSRRDPRSTEALELQRSMRRLRQKTVQRHPREENPGVFREALAQIKSRADGTTYEANYKLDALRTAKRRPHKGAGLLPWTERGPGNVSGRARAIVADAADPSGQTWFVATVGGGIWKTSSAGSSWQNKSPELGTLSTTCIAQCVSQPLVLYVGTGMGYGRIVDLEGSGIWKSIDGGESWSQLASTAFGQILTAINRIVVDPADPDVVVACSNTPYSHLGTKGGSRVSGIFRSVDGGVNWTQTFDSDAVFGTATDNRVQQIVADPANFQRLYATVNEVGVIRSDDGGQSWTVSVNDFALVSDIGNPPGGGLGLSGISVRTEMAVAASDPQRLYAAVERPRGIADLYMSANGGDSWDLLPDTGVDPNWFNNAGISIRATKMSSSWAASTCTASRWIPSRRPGSPRPWPGGFRMAIFPSSMQTIIGSQRFRRGSQACGSSEPTTEALRSPPTAEPVGRTSPASVRRSSTGRTRPPAPTATSAACRTTGRG